ncbi:MAG: DUF3891 family protein, partial [Pirellulales bacterium]
MIRRDATDPDDGSPRWILIPQVEHARLAARLVEAWDGRSIAEHPARAEVLAAIAHHDDGWERWERSPKVDRDSGRPIAFDEMPLGESLAIWRSSIDGCRALGNLAPWMVAGHFHARLLDSSKAHTAEADAWWQEIEPQQARWLEAWLAQSPARHDQAAAEVALAYLQAFDAVSLWFCCAERSEPHRWTAPGDLTLSMIPTQPDQVIVEPWPLRTDT